MSGAESSLVGRVLAQTYRVERLLGKGGMGAVYEAAHLRLPTKVAVKVLHAEAAANEEIFTRFRKEAEITSALRHPNIVQVLDFNHLPDGTPYLVMEYLDGEDLHARLRQRGRLSYQEAVTLLRAIGAGLTAAHKKGVVHRDLKPQNIFLCRQEEGDALLEIPKIVDFGISKIRHAATDTQQTKDQQLLGTPNYMSPEQARGDNSNVDHRTDQWALAAILYQCLTGRLAFAGDSLAAIIYQVVLSEPPRVRTLAPEVPEFAEAAIARALSKDRDARYPSVLDFVRAFCGQPLTAAGEGQAAAQGGLGPMDLAGEHPITPTPGRKATAEFPGSSLPFALTPAAAPLGSVGGTARSGRTEVLPTPYPGAPVTPPGSLSQGQLGSGVGPVPGGGRRGLLIGGVIVGVGALVAIGLGLGPLRPGRGSVGTGKDLTAPPVVEASEVHLRVSSTQPGLALRATVTVAGQERRTDAAGVLLVPRGNQPLTLRVTAPGYRELVLPVVPAVDSELPVTLTAEPPLSPDAGLVVHAPPDEGRPGKEGKRGKRGGKKDPRAGQGSDVEDVDISGIR